MNVNNNVQKLINVMLFGAFIFYVIFFRYFGDVKIAVVAMSSWVVLAFIFSEKNMSFSNTFEKIIFYQKLNPLLVSTIKIMTPHFLFLSFVIIFSYEISKTPGMPIPGIMNYLAFVFLICCLQLRYLNGNPKRPSLDIVIEYSIYYMMFLGILTGHGVRDSIQSHIIFYSIIGVLSSYLLASDNLKIREFASNTPEKLTYILKKLTFFSQKRSITYIFLIIGFIFFSFRTDVLEYASPVLHWAYFTGPTYEIGFQNFFSTLSQYSMTFNLLMSKISPNPHFSVWLGQAVLLNLIFLMGLLLCRKSKYIFSLPFSFAILVLFVDPSSVGPQAYPSSSVVRFFPFYMMVFSYALISNKSDSLISKIIFVTSILLALTWSSLTILSLATAIIMLIGIRFLVNFLNHHNYIERFKFFYKETSLHLLIVIVVLLIITMLGIYTYVFDHQYYYVSTRYGWHSSGSIWVTAPLLFVTVMIIRHILINRDPYAFLLAMPVIASFAYYSYRPLSHNLLAIFPLLFFTLIAMQSSGKGKELESNEDNKTYKRLIRNITISLAIFGIVSFSFQIPNKKETPFSIINITQNNINGLSNKFFSVLNPSEVCKKNELRYREFLSDFYSKFKSAEKTDIPFVVLADFFEVSSFGSCFVDEKGSSIQRRIFYTSPLYNAPLPLSYSKVLIENYLINHKVKEFFVLTSSHNIHAKNYFNSFISQLPKEYKMQKDNLPIIESQYFDGVKNVDISLELVYFGPRDF